MVQSMKYHIAPVFAISHKVITLIVENHLIWADVLMGGFVQLFVCTVFIVIVVELEPFFNGRIDKFDVIKERLVVRFTPIIDGIDMFDAGSEIFI